MNKETNNDNSNTYRRIYRPKPILSGIEEIRQDFEEELVTGTIKYGLEILDDAVGAVRKGSMTFIIAAPNTGKSLLGLQIGVEFAKQNKRVLICSCEMGAGLLMEREIRKEAGISRNELRDLYESRRDIANKIMDSMIEQSQYEYMTRIDICETAGATVEDIIECIQCGSQDGKPYDAVIVDYIQRIAGIGEEYRVITNAARQLQNLARDTGLYLICCSQAGRQSIDEAKFGAKGAVDGSRIKGKGSGSIEEDADVGITLMELFEQGQKYILITLFKNRYGNLKNISYKYRMDDRLRLTLVTKDGG